MARVRLPSSMTTDPSSGSSRRDGSSKFSSPNTTRTSPGSAVTSPARRRRDTPPRSPSRCASAIGCRGCSSGYSGRSPRRSCSTPSAVTLERDMLIAFFIPEVVYMADAIGTQTEALVVRGLSVGVSIGGIFRRELLTGASSVSPLLSPSCPSESLVESRRRRRRRRAVRRLFHGHRRGDNAAVAAPSSRSRSRLRGGPLATVIQDLLSLVICLVVASFVVG